MQVFDASSIIYAWDNYPKEQFPGLWDWMSKQVETRLVAMPNIAFEEVGNKMPECASWLKEGNIELLPVTNSVAQKALNIKRLLGIVSDKYGGGVGENDIIIIASACVNNLQLVSEEQQAHKPNALKNSKIPTVCALKEVSVPCIKFIEYIKASKEVFG